MSDKPQAIDSRWQHSIITVPDDAWKTTGGVSETEVHQCKKDIGGGVLVVTQHRELRDMWNCSFKHPTIAMSFCSCRQERGEHISAVLNHYHMRWREKRWGAGE